jgi:hypothetical protein
VILKNIQKKLEFYDISTGIWEKFVFLEWIATFLDELSQNQKTQPTPTSAKPAH